MAELTNIMSNPSKGTVQYVALKVVYSTLKFIVSGELL